MKRDMKIYGIVIILVVISFLIMICILANEKESMKNEYGFYFNEPYRVFVEDNLYCDAIFYENNKWSICMKRKVGDFYIPLELEFLNRKDGVTYSSLAVSFINGDEDLVFSNNGKSVEIMKHQFILVN